MSDSLYSLFECPKDGSPGFSQNYQLSQVDDDVCTHFTGALSLFQVGVHIYYQKNQLFYRTPIPSAKTFVFDQYFTDLMADNFG